MPGACMSVFRIVRKPAAAEFASGPRAQTPALDGYLDRLIRMIPAEIIGLYLAGYGVIPETDNRGTGPAGRSHASSL